MITIKRSRENPILLPNKENNWEAEATFNGGAIRENNKVHLIYRAVSSPQPHRGLNRQVSSIGHAESSDGVHFSNRRQLIKPEYEWEKFGCEDPRVTKLNDKYFIFYTALSAYPFSPTGIKIGVAVTHDLKTIEEKHPVTFFNSKAMALFPEKINGKIVGILTVHTDIPPAKIAVAFFDQEEQVWSRECWENWYSSLDSHLISLMRSANDQVELGAPPLKTQDGWLLIYSHIKNYRRPPRTFGVEAVLLNLKNPLKVLGRTQKPIMVPEKDYELNGNVPKVIFPSGALVCNKKLFVYYGAADTSCCLAECNLEALLEELRPKKGRVFIKSKNNGKKLRRFKGNPLIRPIIEHPWEAKATFNPGAIYEAGKVHLVYRAMSEDKTSVLGYASSFDGVHLEERLTEPIYVPREKFEMKAQPGNSGCEDPRITKLGNRFYMCYTAFDGKNPHRVALTSIEVNDFLAKRWKWKKPILISPPGVADKNACVLPKKIKGKYVIFHRMGVCICINFVDDLDFGENRWLESGTLISPRPSKWDNRKIGIGAPPIETKDGWLLIYHGVSEPGTVYKVGAALLELNNPAQVIARTDESLLEPEMEYEKEGQISNVVFPCGAVVVKNQALVYYGGADKVVGVATVNLNEILEEIKKFPKEDFHEG